MLSIWCGIVKGLTDDTIPKSEFNAKCTQYISVIEPTLIRYFSITHTIFHFIIGEGVLFIGLSFPQLLLLKYRECPELYAMAMVKTHEQLPTDFSVRDMPFDNAHNFWFFLYYSESAKGIF